MKPLIYLISCITLLWSCRSDDAENTSTNLAAYVANATVENGAVIACAASDAASTSVLTFYYVEAGAEDVRLYQTNTADIDETNLSNYTQVLVESAPVFGGVLERFSQTTTTDRWLIVSFMLDGEIKLSNPIRTKPQTKPTLWNDIVTIADNENRMPLFSWQDNSAGDTAIYFQVLTDNNDNFLSGTYTIDDNFQYYKLENVVLNITKGIPPNLEPETAYRFTLMDVSLDNWVNVLTYKKQFIIK